jgi:hypothetical protein
MRSSQGSNDDACAPSLGSRGSFPWSKDNTVVEHLRAYMKLYDETRHRFTVELLRDGTDGFLMGAISRMGGRTGEPSGSCTTEQTKRGLDRSRFPNERH